ncbi:predicted protein [Naegleria gruberi]|uniref:Predicted protein n=1 Tax=Naegleria gruberi TaxID=5762 RepID=D2UX46_NAEGR|nr:uncharacterized protein NAEGRDRAFT_61632 [Naegleria gruberi]EFC50560.1 predicted protein [Naegleria gruberi]|eukprot:XP_002683304.1 predicted protein [Naegleria gruberi strain NEG-M]
MSSQLHLKRQQKQIQDAIDKYYSGISNDNAMDIKKDTQLLSGLVGYLSGFQESDLAFETRGDVIERFFEKYYNSFMNGGNYPPELYSDKTIWDLWLLYAEAHTNDPIPHIQTLLEFAPKYPKLFEVWATWSRRTGRIDDELTAYEEAETRGVVSELLSSMKQDRSEYFQPPPSQQQTIPEPKIKTTTTVTNTVIKQPVAHQSVETLVNNPRPPSPTPQNYLIGYDKNLIFTPGAEFTFEELRAMHYLNTTDLMINHKQTIPSSSSISHNQSLIEQPKHHDSSILMNKNFEKPSSKPQQKDDDFEFDFSSDITTVHARKSMAATPTSYAQHTIASFFEGTIDTEIENNYFEQRKFRKVQEQEKKRKLDEISQSTNNNFAIHEDTTAEIKKSRLTAQPSSSTFKIPSQTSSGFQNTSLQQERSFSQRNRSLSAFHQFNDTGDESGLYFGDESNISKTFIVDRQQESAISLEGISALISKYTNNGVINPYMEDIRKVYTNIVNITNCFKDSRITDCKGVESIDLKTILLELSKKKKGIDYNTQTLSLKLSTKTYLAEEALSEHVIKIQDVRSNNGINTKSFALKFKPPNDFYEYYVIDQLYRRIPEKENHRFPNIQRVYVMDNDILLMENLVNNITLTQAISQAKIEETIALYYTLELLNILQTLHNKANITHNNISPSNLLLLNEDTDLSDWSIDGKGWSNKGLLLTNFSRSIDLELFPNRVVFQSEPKTLPEVFKSSIQYPNKWKYASDTWSVCNIIHQMLFKKDMEVTTNAQDKYLIKESIRRFWKFRDVWQTIFDTLLNLDQTKSPDYYQLIEMCQQALGTNGDTVKALFLRFIVSLSTQLKH